LFVVPLFAEEPVSFYSSDYSNPLSIDPFTGLDT